MPDPEEFTEGRPSQAPPSAAGTQWPGLVLLLPAALALIFQQVVPGVRTLVLSLLGSGWSADALSAGWAGMSGAQTPEAGRIVATGIALGVPVAVLGTGAGLLLGLLLRRASGRWQRIGLAMLGVALLSYGPGSMVLTGDETSGLVWAIAGWQVAVLPLLVLLGALVGLVARASRVLVVLAAVIVLGGVVILAQGAIGVPSAPEDDAAWAAVSVLLGVALAVLGVAAGLLLHGVRPRFDLGRAKAVEPTGHTRSRRGILAVVSCGVVLTVLVVLAVPWLSQVGQTGVDQLGSEATSLTWSAIAVNALELVLTVAVTGSAAIGLGYLRVLGRRSLAALLLVSPWFFLGWLPLFPGIEAGVRIDPSHAPFYGLSAQLLCVPLLFLLTYLADGVRRVRGTGRRPEVVATAALAALSVAILAVVRSQDVLWDLTFAFPGAVPSPAWVVQQVQAQTFDQVQPLGILTPAPLLVLGAVVCAAAAALVPGTRLVAGTSPEAAGTRKRSGRESP